MGFWIFMFVFCLFQPVLMIAMGNVFLKCPPKNINDIYGYRTTMSGKNQETWDFAHHYCGKVWHKVGWVLFVLTLPVMLPVIGKSEDTVGFTGGILVMIQCVVLVGSVFPVERALSKEFDKDGNRK